MARTKGEGAILVAGKKHDLQQHELDDGNLETYLHHKSMDSFKQELFSMVLSLLNCLHFQFIKFSFSALYQFIVIIFVSQPYPQLY